MNIADIDIVYVHFNETGQELSWAQWLLQQPADFRREVSRFRNWQDQTRTILGRLLLLYALRRYNIASSVIHHIQRTDFGRPYIADLFDFNISHSGNYVICAFSKHNIVGIDIEKIAPIDFAHYHSVMTPAQWHRIQTSTDPFCSFFKYWAIKESVIKADGRGFHHSLDTLETGESSVWLDGRLWYIKELKIDEGYRSCIAYDLPQSNIHIEELLIADLI